MCFNTESNIFEHIYKTSEIFQAFSELFTTSSEDFSQRRRTLSIPY